MARIETTAPMPTHNTQAAGMRYLQAKPIAGGTNNDTVGEMRFRVEE